MNNTSSELPKALNQRLAEASGACNQSLAAVKERESLGELNVYARLVGRFLGHSYTNILAPLWERFPELEPEEMKGEYVERQATLSPESRAAISASPALPFGGVSEVAKSVEEIERFLASPRFGDETPDGA